MRRRSESAEDKLYRYYHKAIIRPISERMKALRSLLTLFCRELEVSQPSLYHCGILDQNACINKKKKAPCAGGCYDKSRKMILIRAFYNVYDTLLHELFHHVDHTNNGRAINKIMSGWHRDTFSTRKGYGFKLRMAGIPTDRRE